jgi:hypothetical protein
VKDFWDSNAKEGREEMGKRAFHLAGITSNKTQKERQERD